MTEIFVEEGDLNLRVEGDCDLGSRSHFHAGHGNWLPGDSPEVTNLKVYLTAPEQDDIEITTCVPESTKSYYESLLLEKYEEFAS